MFKPFKCIMGCVGDFPPTLVREESGDSPRETPTFSTPGPAVHFPYGVLAVGLVIPACKHLGPIAATFPFKIVAVVSCPGTCTTSPGPYYAIPFGLMPWAFFNCLPGDPQGRNASGDFSGVRVPSVVEDADGANPPSVRTNDADCALVPLRCFGVGRMHVRCLFGLFVGASITSLIGPGNNYTDVFDGHVGFYPSSMVVLLALPSLCIADVIDYPP